MLTLAIGQGGDYIGGEKATRFNDGIQPMRKAMNSFICSVDRPFQFIDRINEDVNTYVLLGSRGGVFLSILQIGLDQLETQSNSGGMTELYLDAGTYVKEFFTVMYCPSCVVVSAMGTAHRRLHHHIKWRYAVPKILHESVKKVTTNGITPKQQQIGERPPECPSAARVASAPRTADAVSSDSRRGRTAVGVFGNAEDDQDRLGFARQRMAGRSREQHTAGVRRGADGVRPRYCGAMAAVRSQQAETSCQAGKGSHGTRRYKHVRKPLSSASLSTPPFRSNRKRRVSRRNPSATCESSPKSANGRNAATNCSASTRYRSTSHRAERNSKGFSSVLPVMPGIDEIVRRIDEERERKLSEEDE